MAQLIFLLGLDLYSQIPLPEAPIVSDVVALPTIFGYVIPGKPQEKYQNNYIVTNLISQFWEIEEPNPLTLTNPCEDIVEQLFLKTYSRTNEGRYVLSLLFNDEISPQFNNRTQALKRFFNLRKQFKTNNNLYQFYKDFILEYQRLGHMKLLNLLSI